MMDSYISPRMIAEADAESLHTIAVKVSRNIHRMSDAEHGRSIDKYGRVSNFVGDMDEVGIDINEDTRITVHNHTSDYKIPTTFSRYDVYNFIANKQLIEIIVCCYGYYYYLRRGTYTGTAMCAADFIRDIRSTTHDKALKEFSMNYKANPSKSLKTALKEANLYAEEAVHQEMLTQLSEKGLIYGRCKL